LAPPKQFARFIEGLERGGIGSHRLQFINQRQPLVDFFGRQDRRDRRGVEVLVAKNYVR